MMTMTAEMPHSLSMKEMLHAMFGDAKSEVGVPAHSEESINVLRMGANAVPNIEDRAEALVAMHGKHGAAHYAHHHENATLFGEFLKKLTRPVHNVIDAFRPKTKAASVKHPELNAE